MTYNPRMATAPAIQGSFLGDIPIFGGLQPAVLDRIAASMRTVTYREPRVVVAEGDLAREMFVVRSGRLEVTKRGRGGDEVRLATLREGDCMGEMALLDIQPRSASVRTTGATTLLVLGAEDLADLFRADPESYTLLVLNISREISRRLRRADELLADMMITAQEIWGRPETPPVPRKPRRR